MKLNTGSYNECEVNFEKIDILGDGYCGFTTLGITREELAESLRNHSKREDIREQLCEEVYEAFFTELIPDECSLAAKAESLQP